jgi:glyoxylase-like metal-dependent hydrolase (beta-lactamase superfamily II)/predicted ester cyclase
VVEPEASPKRPSKTATRKAALAYFDAINARDLDGATSCWAEGGAENVHGQRLVVARDGVFAFLGELMGAFPDLRFDVEETICDGDRCVVRSTLRGTFAGPGRWAGVEPTGDRLEVPVVDCLVIRDGLIVANDAYADGMTIARQMGLLPAQDSNAEQRLTRVANARTRASDRLLGKDVGQVAEGVWRVQGGPARCNVYLVRDPEGGPQAGDGVLMFDAGARVMTRAVAQAAARLGGLTRIVLGHGHTDHRGTAPAFDVPVLCHPDEVEDAEGSGGFRYWGDLSGLGWRAPVHRMLHRRFWDGGPVKIADTVAEGDDVAGFRVVHLPGHAPGLIALFREHDRLALTSDCFYTLDAWGRDCEPHLPMDVYNLDTEQARASVRKLAALEPAACWPGHAGAVAGTDVRARLERAAETAA